MRTHTHVRGHVGWFLTQVTLREMVGVGWSGLISSPIPAQGSPGRELSASGLVTMVPNRRLGMLRGQCCFM